MITTRVIEGKQQSDVLGIQSRCINYSGCPICYGCRAYDSRDPQCQYCKEDDIKRGKNYHICNTSLHEAWKINKLVSKNKIAVNETLKFVNGNEVICINSKDSIRGKRNEYSKNKNS